MDFRQEDIFDLPFDGESFDHVVVCLVLEHLSRPVGALTALSRLLLRPGGTITVIGDDHGSTYTFFEGGGRRKRT